MRGIVYDVPGIHFLDKRGAQYGKPTVEIDGKVYQLGEEVHVEDGVYIDFDTVIVIHDHRFIAVERHLFNKWKDEIDMSALVTSTDKSLLLDKSNICFNHSNYPKLCKSSIDMYISSHYCTKLSVILLKSYPSFVFSTPLMTILPPSIAPSNFSLYISGNISINLS